MPSTGDTTFYYSSSELLKAILQYTTMPLGPLGRAEQQETKG